MSVSVSPFGNRTRGACRTAGSKILERRYTIFINQISLIRCFQHLIMQEYTVMLLQIFAVFWLVQAGFLIVK